VSVDAISGSSRTADAASTDAAGKKDPMGRDMFLQLLITQLQHQDPMQPQENGEFLAQLAQFSSLENLQQIKDDMAALRAALEGAPATSATGKNASASASTTVPPGTLVDPSTVSNTYVAPGY
jgi:flagellar basal-body rod modification protein FlgD